MNKAYLMGILYLIVYSFSLNSIFGFEPLPYSSPENLAAGLIPALSSDPASAISNPVAGDRGFSSSIQYISSMKELPLYGVNSISGKGIYSILAGAEFFNNDDYTAQNYYLGGRLESPFFRLGAAYHTAFDKVEGYNSDSQSWFKTGLRLGTELGSIEACAENLWPTHRDRAEQIPDYTISSAWWVDKNVQSGFGVSLYPHREAVWQFGTRTRFIKGLDTIVTWQNDPSCFAYCVILSVKALQLSYAVKTHPELDWSQSLGLAVLLP